MKDEFWAASVVNGIMDDLTTLNRGFTQTYGYPKIDRDEYRFGLSDAADRLVRLNCQLLTGVTQVELNFGGVNEHG